MSWEADALNAGNSELEVQMTALEEEMQELKDQMLELTRLQEVTMAAVAGVVMIVKDAAAVVDSGSRVIRLPR